MQGRSHSLGDHSAFHRALIASVYVAIVLLCGSSPARPAGPGWLTRQIDNCLEQIEASNQAAAPAVRLDIRFADDLLKERVELAEPTDDDKTKHSLLPSDVVLPLDVAALGGQTGLYKSSADRAALTPFRLRAFSGRGSPSA